MPRCIVFSMDTGYCGMDGHEFEVFPDDVTNEELDRAAWEHALSNAESYGIYNRADYENCPDISEEELDSDDYVDSIDGWWEDFDPKKHDGLVTGGGSATELFESLLKKFNE